MQVNDILRKLDLGSSVAEHDEALEAYFIETETFRALVDDRRDTIAGDKETGKTALYRILQKRYPTLMKDVEVLAGFNPTGAPVFQRLVEGEPLEEGQYITIWKAYVLSLVGNWILAVNEDALSYKMQELDTLLKRTGLSSADDTASTVFSQIVNLFRRVMNPKSAQITATITQDGLPGSRRRSSSATRVMQSPSCATTTRSDCSTRCSRKSATPSGLSLTAWTRHSRASPSPRCRRCARCCARTSTSPSSTASP
jgi:hypothetical protein